jgi:hypothetical protein
MKKPGNDKKTGGQSWTVNILPAEQEKEAAIVEATLKTKPRNATHWSTRMMAATQKVSDTTAHRIWRAHRLQPHRLEKF